MNQGTHRGNDPAGDEEKQLRPPEEGAAISNEQGGAAIFTPPFQSNTSLPSQPPIAAPLLPGSSPVSDPPPPPPRIGVKDLPARSRFSSEVTRPGRKNLQNESGVNEVVSKCTSPVNPAPTPPPAPPSRESLFSGSVGRPMPTAAMKKNVM